MKVAFPRDPVPDPGGRKGIAAAPGRAIGVPARHAVPVNGGGVCVVISARTPGVNTAVRDSMVT